MPHRKHANKEVTRVSGTRSGVLVSDARTGGVHLNAADRAPRRRPNASRGASGVATRVALVSDWFHAGDIIMCRALIRRLRPLLVGLVELELRCHRKHAYLWDDMELPICYKKRRLKTIHMWWRGGRDLFKTFGLTHATQVASYNRQAKVLGLPKLDPAGATPELDFAQIPIHDPPGVLVENGPVFSGQKTLDLNPILGSLAASFPSTIFYCVARPPNGYPNLIDISQRNLKEISALSNVCVAMVSRLSGPFVATLTSQNRGRLPRFVFGGPIGYRIWDESDVTYCPTNDQLHARLRGVLG